MAKASSQKGRRKARATLKAQQITEKARRKLTEGASSRTCAMLTILKQPKMVKAPLMVMALVAAVMCHPDLQDFKQNIGWVEYYAGCEALTRAFLDIGVAALSFELKDDDVIQNMLHHLGFIYAVHIGLRIMDGGGSNTDPVCSTWVWVNRATSGRGSYKPLGSASRPSVRDGNEMVSRQMMLCWILTARLIWWVLEQPANSLMEKHPGFAELRRAFTIHRVSINMSDFGSAAKKPSWIYSNMPVIAELADHAGKYAYKGEPVKLVKTYQDASGRVRVSGQKALKASQAYPVGFARALASIYSKHQGEFKKAAKENVEAAQAVKLVKADFNVGSLTGAARWSDARLKDVFDNLKAVRPV